MHIIGVNGSWEKDTVSNCLDGVTVPEKSEWERLKKISWDDNLLAGGWAIGPLNKSLVCPSDLKAYEKDGAYSSFNKSFEISGDYSYLCLTETELADKLVSKEMLKEFKVSETRELRLKNSTLLSCYVFSSHEEMKKMWEKAGEEYLKKVIETRTLDLKLAKVLITQNLSRGELLMTALWTYLREEAYRERSMQLSEIGFKREKNPANKKDLKEIVDYLESLHLTHL